MYRAIHVVRFNRDNIIVSELGVFVQWCHVIYSCSERLFLKIRRPTSPS